MPAVSRGVTGEATPAQTASPAGPFAFVLRSGKHRLSVTAQGAALGAGCQPPAASP